MTWERARPYVAFALAWAGSRALSAACGLGFSTEHVAAIMHFPDVDLLRDRLLETTLHLHGQPPLMPLLMGAVFKTCGESWPAALAALMHAAGLGAGLVLVSILRDLGFSGRTAAGAATAFTLLPACVVYEHYWFFTLPTVFLLCAVARLVLAAARRGTGRAWAWPFLAAAVLLNWRNSFHWAWLLALLSLGLAATPRGRRRAVVLAFLPALALGLAWPAKNYLLFGRFEASSWSGFGLARKTYHQAGLGARRAWAAEGRLDPIAGVDVFGPVADYAAVVGRPPLTGIPVLDRDAKGSGWNNFHHAVYLEANARMRTEAFRLIREHPEYYVRDVLRTIDVLFRPATEWGPVRTPYLQSRAFCDAIDGALFARLGAPGLCPWSVLAIVVLAASVPAGVRVLRRRAAADAGDVLLAFAGGTILYVYAAAVLFDTNESMRHRFQADGLVWTGAALLVRRTAGRLRRKRAAGDGLR